MPTRATRAFILVALLAALSACASTRAVSTDNPANPAGDIAAQPVRDLNITRVEIAQVLLEAAQAPYAAPVPSDCPHLSDRILELDKALGLDVDAAGEKRRAGDAVGDLLMDAARGVFSLPFRGVVRRISGAERHDRDQRAAILAGMVRRGYLKGMARAQGCPPQ